MPFDGGSRHRRCKYRQCETLRERSGQERLHTRIRRDTQARPISPPASSSPQELQAKLDVPGVPGARNASKILAAENHGWGIQIGIVQQVKALETELERLRFGEAKLFV